MKVHIHIILSLSEKYLKGKFFIQNNRNKACDLGNVFSRMLFTKCNYFEAKRKKKGNFLSMFTPGKDKANLNILQTSKTKAYQLLLYFCRQNKLPKLRKNKASENLHEYSFFLSSKETFSTNCLCEKFLKHKFHTTNSYLYRLPKTFVFRRMEKS